ncbi:hypothetical protein FGADI_8437 [Fusarium gaditjirri]|uniref:Phosphoribosyltransferase domain-containing protein n=1 Tax=Fusarium gaditjirri TaxID=282569 RepID=A0A8H4T2F9_9HYPO|nr:hypothetical protein FGADI_8437 [Fusarium gaditjirri]
MLFLWLFLLSLIIWRLHVSYSHFSKVPYGIPWSPRGRFTPYLVTQIAGIWNIPSVMEKAYQDYGKKGSICVIALPFSRPEVLLPQSLIRWMTTQNDKILSPIPVQHEVVGAEYAFLNSAIRKDFAVYDILRVQLNRHLPRLIPRIAEELASSIDGTFGMDTEWNEVCVYALVRKVIARITVWLVLGGILSTDNELAENLSNFSSSVIPSAIALSLFPRFLQPVTSRLTSVFNHIYMNRALKILGPHIEKRIIAIENGLLEDLPQDDVLTWHIHEALRKKERRFEMADVVACRVFATVFAALESTTLTMTYALFNVCASHPSTQVWQALEEEALSFFPTNVDQTSLNDLNIADSVIKETLRLNTAIKALSVEVMQEDGLTIEDRMIHLPQGARMSVSGWGIHHDEDMYPNAYDFHPFRFVPLHKDEGIQDAQSLATPSENYIPFGIGKHSCPGRQFAAVVAKVFLAYLSVNYDMEEVHKKPCFMSLGHLPVPPSSEISEMPFASSSFILHHTWTVAHHTVQVHLCFLSRLPNMTSLSLADLVSRQLDQNPSKPTVIGIYGLPASGKSFILEALRKELGETEFTFFEGSEVISSLVPGGLDSFQKLQLTEKAKWRVKAINHLRDEVATSGRIAIVTGHLMFWSEVNDAPYAVYTLEDLKTFTHIIYLAPNEKTIASHIESDKKKKYRSYMADLTAKDWNYWQRDEFWTLRDLCRQHKILFISVNQPSLENVLPLVKHFKQLAPAGANLALVKKRLDEIVAMHDTKKLQTFLVFDGDRTLTAEDGGRLLVDEIDENGTGPCDSALRDLYSGPMGYSDEAFHQATLILEEECPDDMFEDRCDTVSAFIPLYTEFLTLLRRITQQKHIGAVVVTCGVGRLWTKILKHHGLSDKVKVIGGGRLSDGYYVTPGVKAAIVSHLRDVHDLYVLAFGDSPLDIPMLCEADKAFVVVGDEESRSSTMDAALSMAIQDGHLRARQILLPSKSSPRLDKDRLPVISLGDKKLVKSITERRKDLPPLKSFDATNKSAAKVLMSPMRDAAVSGPALREAHANVGRYLAIEYVSKIIGLEEYTIPHVQGHKTIGHRLRNEAKTSIVAQMRDGEPMAFGISDVFPQAMFIHASGAEDLEMHHVQGQSNVILVDSVVNSGKSVIEFIKRAARLEPNIDITVVAGVVQSEAVAKGHLFEKVMRRHDAGLIALRLSGNRFTGTKTTDTGNRLFNTTHLA